LGGGEQVFGIAEETNLDISTHSNPFPSGSMPVTIETNKAIIHQWLKAWTTCDLALIDELFTATYTVNETLIGSAGVKQAVQFFHAALADLSIELKDLVAEDDKVVVQWTVRGRQIGEFMGIPPTGQDIELKGINLYRVVEGKLAANSEQTNIVEVVQRLKTASP
jgi:steroid delta-isomerase-like uncharacterized protein